MPAHRQAVPAAHSRTHPGPALRPQQLPCPVCGHGLYLASRDFVEGRELLCAHCETRPLLTRDWDERSNRYRWVLLDPDADSDDAAR
ncbi:MAG: hypothetical protein HYV18_05400 [Gammaproteobacteria bacterium]|nr:hypothetical protein [Gammaproteobacteria bacterium]